MKRIYVIDELKGFNKLLDNEGITEGSEKENILNSFKTLLNIRVEIEERKEGGYYEFIYNNITNERMKYSDFNPYQNSLINECFSHFIGIRKDLNACIENLTIVN